MQDLNRLLSKAKYQARQSERAERLIRQKEADRLFDIQIKKHDLTVQYYNDYKVERGKAVTASLNPAFRKEAELFALASVIALQDICIKAYPGFTVRSFNIFAKFDWSLRRTRSRGGDRKGPHISMAMIRNTMLFPYTEYSHIDSDPEIGGINATTWQDRLLLVLAHEIAHVAARKLFKYEKRTSHGIKWQGIYRLLRVSYVNPRNGSLSTPARVIDQKKGKISLNSLLLRSKLAA